MAKIKIIILAVLLSISVLQQKSEAKNTKEPIDILVNISSGCDPKIRSIGQIAGCSTIQPLVNTGDFDG